MIGGRFISFLGDAGPCVPLWGEQGGPVHSLEMRRYHNRSYTGERRRLYVSHASFLFCCTFSHTKLAKPTCIQKRCPIFVSIVESASIVFMSETSAIFKVYNHLPTTPINYHNLLITTHYHVFFITSSWQSTLYTTPCMLPTWYTTPLSHAHAYEQSQQT